jgi:hypothetical protein
MKTRLVFATLFVTSLAAFGTHTQPKPSSQFRVTHSRQSSKANHRTELHERGGAAARPPAAEKTATANPARKGRFKSRPATSSSASTVSFVAAARFPLGGTDDDNTESVIGDFNGDGKKDVAKIASVGSTYSISVLLGNGDGTFQAAKLTATPSNVDDPIIVGDVNGDGKDDIVQVHPAGGNCGVAPRAGVKPAVLPCGASIDVLISNGDGTFATAVNYSVTVDSLVGGLLTDINGDGKLDVLAFDNLNPGNAIQMLGKGDGTFQTASTLATLTGPAPGAMIFGDFNGDGKLDFAGFEGSQVGVSLASGSGWAAPVLLTTGDGNYDSCSNTLGDLTGDGKPEIVSVNCYELNTVTVYVNNGDGTFQPGVYYNNTGDQSQTPNEATIADVNGDGNGDIVISNESGGGISILLGDGTGRVVAEGVTYGIGGFPWTAPLIADFNGDGLMDVVASDDYFNMVYLQGYGDGSYRAAVTYPLPNSFDQYATSGSVAIADVNGDGIPDSVVGQTGNYASTGFVVYLGKGDGTFYPGETYGESTSLRFVAVADFNGDGKLDVAASDTNNEIHIFLGNGDGTFAVGASLYAGTNPQNVVTGDFNHDGTIDLATPNVGVGTISVLLGHGDGTFANAVMYDVTAHNNPSILTAADLNGDGYLDLVVTALYGPSAVGVFLGNSDNSGTFQPVTFTDTDGYPFYVAFGDLNKDGKLDMAITESQGTTYPGLIQIALGNGDGTFGALASYPSTTLGSYPNPADIQILDLDGDGNPDLVYINQSFGTVAVMLGNGDGTVNAPLEFPGNGNSLGLALADVNGDGVVDVVTGNINSGGLTAFLNGAGSGTSPNYTMGTKTPTATVAAGSPAMYVLNLAGLNGYTGTITFACGELPTAATCSFNPSSVIALGNTPLTTSLTIDTTVRSGSLLRPAWPGSQAGSPILLASLSGMGLFGLMLAGSGAKGRRRRAAIVLGAVLLVTLGMLAACDNDTAAKIPPPPPPATGTPAGSYLVTVTSTGTGTGAPTHSVNVTLIVQ